MRRTVVGIGLAVLCLLPLGSKVRSSDSDQHILYVPFVAYTTPRLMHRQVIRDSVGGVQGMRYPQSAALSADGRHVYVVSMTYDKVVVLARDDTSGKLSFVSSFQYGQGGGYAPMSYQDAVRAIALSPDGEFVYVIDTSEDYGNGKVVILLRNTNTGNLTMAPTDSGAGINPVTGPGRPRFLTISPDSNHLFVGGLGDPDGGCTGFTVFRRDGSSGLLTYVEAHCNDGDASLYGDVAVSPDNRYVYVIGDIGAFTDALILYARDTTTGTLSFVEAYRGGTEQGGYPIGEGQEIAVSPDGHHIYEIGRNELVVYARDGSSGEVSGIQELRNFGTDGSGNVVEGLDTPSALAISPDGKTVYVASKEVEAWGTGNDALSSYDRDATTGRLTYIETLRNGMADAYGNTVNGLDGAKSVQVSPDGCHIYVVGESEHAVAVFLARSGTCLAMGISTNHYESN